MKQTTRLRQLLAQGPTLLVPGCYDSLSAPASSSGPAFPPST